MPGADEFRAALQTMLKAAQDGSAVSIDIEAGQLHRKVGGYPGPGHRMPVCCAVMYDEQRAGDELIAQPPKGKGASLKIRYRLPR